MHFSSLFFPPLPSSKGKFVTLIKVHLGGGVCVSTKASEELNWASGRGYMCYLIRLSTEMIHFVIVRSNAPRTRASLWSICDRTHAMKGRSRDLFFFSGPSAQQTWFKCKWRFRRVDLALEGLLLDFLLFYAPHTHDFFIISKTFHIPETHIPIVYLTTYSNSWRTGAEQKKTQQKPKLAEKYVV